MSGRPEPGSHTPRPAPGTLESCLNPAHHDGQLLYEVWCHPADTDDLLQGGIRRVNGAPAKVVLVDRLACADQLRIHVHAPVDIVTDPAVEALAA